MNKLILILVTLFTAACSTAPVIVPDTTQDSVVMQRLKWEIANHNKLPTNWGWILWYLPLVAAAMIWMWRKYIKQCPDCGKSDEVKQLNG